MPWSQMKRHVNCSRSYTTIMISIQTVPLRPDILSMATQFDVARYVRQHSNAVHLYCLTAQLYETGEATSS